MDEGVVMTDEGKKSGGLDSINRREAASGKVGSVSSFVYSPKWM